MKPCASSRFAAPEGPLLSNFNRDLDRPLLAAQRLSDESRDAFADRSSIQGQSMNPSLPSVCTRPAAAPAIGAL
jgi:hypothetical protein